MTVNVATGEILVPGSSSSTQGVYYGRVSSSTSLVISTSSPSNPRIDMVYAAITDAAYTGATNTFTVAVATGTPTVGATLTNLTGAPALPTSAIILAYVLVPTSATDIITADLSDQRIMATFSPLAISGSSLKNYYEIMSTNAASGTAATLNISNGNVFDVTLTGNCTFTFSNPVASGNSSSFGLLLRSGAGSFATTWPASVHWVSAPTTSSTASKVDAFGFWTVNGGTTWFGFVGGIGFTP